MILSVFTLIGGDPHNAQHSTRGAQFSAEAKISQSQIIVNVERPEQFRYLDRQDFHKWALTAASSIKAFYKDYPLARTVITVHAGPGETVLYGESTYNDELAQGEIEVQVGRETSFESLINSWTLTHEMVHLTFPIVHEEDRWLAEGIATYVEPIARKRTGLISEEQVWQELAEGLPQGFSEASPPYLRIGNFRGTRHRGEMYWGGALFCLLADLKIRESTSNRMGLEDALVSIVQAGGTSASDWSARKALSVADAKLGKPVLLPLFEQFQDEQVEVDLQELYDKLGLVNDRGEFKLNDEAPLLPLRLAIIGNGGGK
jgi:hypothetical protein